MFIGIFYISIHLAAIIAAILLVAFKSRWVWIPYLVLFGLEATLLWRVMEGQPYPIWLSNPYSFGLGAIVFAAPFLRWLRTRALLHLKWERVSLATILLVNITGAGLWLASSHQQNLTLTARETEEKLRDLANQDQLQAMIDTLDQAPQALQLPLQKIALDSALTYSSPSTAVALMRHSPEAVTVEHVLFSIRESKQKFVEAALGHLPQLRHQIVANQAQHTPLTLAIESGNLGVVLFLLKHFQPTERDSDGMTALMQAASFGHSTIVKSIVERYPEAVGAKDNNGMTALMHAVTTRGKLGVDHSSLPEILALLLGKGEDPNAVDKNELSVLDHALRGPVWSTKPQAVNQLVLAGAKALSQVGERDFQPMRTIHPEGLSQSEQRELWQKTIAYVL